MQLVIMIIHDSDHMNSILVKMMEAGIKGGSLIDCEGALQAIGRASSDPPPVFGSLREYLNPESAAKNKLLLCAMVPLVSEVPSSSTHPVHLFFDAWPPA